MANAVHHSRTELFGAFCFYGLSLSPATVFGVGPISVDADNNHGLMGGRPAHYDLEP